MKFFTANTSKTYILLMILAINLLFIPTCFQSNLMNRNLLKLSLKTESGNKLKLKENTNSYTPPDQNIFLLNTEIFTSKPYFYL